MKALRHFLAALSFVVLSSTVQAAGFNTPQSGASYTAQGQGGITFFDNAGLVVQNPSAMVKLETGIHVYGGFARYETKYNYKDLDIGQIGIYSVKKSTSPFISIKDHTQISIKEVEKLLVEIITDIIETNEFINTENPA